jgi:hypothetical protein
MQVGPGGVVPVVPVPQIGARPTQPAVPPPPKTLSIEDAFSNLVVEQPPQPPPTNAFRPGEEVVYVDSQGKAFPAIIKDVSALPPAHDPSRLTLPNPACFPGAPGRHAAVLHGAAGGRAGEADGLPPPQEAAAAASGRRAGHAGRAGGAGGRAPASAPAPAPAPAPQ